MEEKIKRIFNEREVRKIREVLSIYRTVRTRICPSSHAYSTIYFYYQWPNLLIATSLFLLPFCPSRPSPYGSLSLFYLPFTKVTLLPLFFFNKRWKSKGN